MENVPDSEAERKRIQRSRNLVLALLLAGFAVLTFAISIVKMS
ncbi:MAG TPA: hypothetical protein VGE05_00265 [Novosphingobium sp.]